MSDIFPEQPITSLPEAVAFLGALPMPVVPVPQPSERDRLRAAFVAALDEAHKTHPCPVTGRPYWSGCVHYDDAGHVSGVGSCHSERRADAVLTVRDAEVEFLTGEADRLSARVAELEAEAERHSTNEALSEAAEALRVQRDRIAELETGIAWRDAERDRWAGVRYLVEKAIDKGWGSVDTIDLESELGPEPASVPAESVAEPPCPCPPADQPGPHQLGCPLAEVPRPLVAAPREDVSPQVEKLRNLLAGRRAAVEDPHDSPLHHPYLLGHDLPSPDGA